MRIITLALACISVSACMTTSDSAEVRATASSNLAAANAQAAALPNETDADSRAVMCNAFLTMSINDRSSTSGYDRVAMEQARSQWFVDLRSRLNQMEADQYAASTSATLQYAERAPRDRAANYCVQNAPDPA